MPKLSKRLLTLLRLALAVGMLYFLFQSGSIDWQSLTGLLGAWHFTLLAIVLFICAASLHATRLQVLINARDLDLSLLAAIKLTFIGLFFNAYLPGSTGGDLIKVYYACKGNPGQRTEVVTVLLLDRVVGLFGLLTLPLLIAPFFTDLIASQPIIQALLIITLVVTLGIILTIMISVRIDLANNHLMQWVESRIKYGELITRALHTVHAYKINLSVIFLAVFYSWLHQLFMIGVALAIAEAISAQGADWSMIALIPFGYLANALPITPGGLGVGEAAMESIFALNNLHSGAEVLLGWRLIMIVVGLIGLAFFLKGEKRFVFGAKANQN